MSSDGRWGVYVHVPWCRTICPYCDFNVHRDRSPPWDAFAAALIAELHARRPAFPSTGAATLYFGGGTPSLMPPDVVARIVADVRAVAGLVAGAEITLEANPDGLDAATLMGLRAAGITRLSLGWQSTHDHLLRRLGRRHDAAAGRQAVVAARAAGFASLSLDLIFAVPGQTRAELAADLASLIAHRPEHVSLYALTYEPGTPFARRRAAGRLVATPEATEVAMMDDIDAALGAAGFEHYEVSNFARPGARAQHNSLYWQGAPYLGLGPGAHSFLRQGWATGRRWEGTRRPADYLAAWAAGRAAGVPRDADDEAVTFTESLTAVQLRAERLMCALRLPDGIDLAAPPCDGAAAALAPAVTAAQGRGWATRDGTRLKPTSLGLRHADALAALFF